MNNTTIIPLLSALLPAIALLAYIIWQDRQSPGKRTGVPWPGKGLFLLRWLYCGSGAEKGRCSAGCGYYRKLSGRLRNGSQIRRKDRCILKSKLISKRSSHARRPLLVYNGNFFDAVVAENFQCVGIDLLTADQNGNRRGTADTGVSQHLSQTLLHRHLP